MLRILPRPTYANVMATIAVVVSLGGTSYAAGVLLTGKNIKDGSLTGVDLKDASVAGADLKNGSVTSADLGKDSVRGSNLAKGAVSGANIADGAVDGANIANGAIGGAKISKGAVSGESIADGAVTGADVTESTLDTVPNAAALGGRDAVQIMTRARGTSSQTGGTYPMTATTWTQGADETDEFFGEVTYSGPGGSCMNTFNSTVNLRFELNGALLANVEYGGEGTFTKTFQLDSLVFEPGTATARDLAVKVEQSPTGCGPVTVQSLKVNVVGYK